MAERRFEFGSNWNSFLETLDGGRINRARESLISLLRLDTSTETPLTGKTFLDLGCGSGLFSLAAYRLGAHVTSIDYDTQCVACTEALREREHADRERWILRQGSAIEQPFMRTLGQFDVVYSWGVLHHTGEMATGIQFASQRVEADGLFAIAIYNDQGGASRRWLSIKKLYNRLPKLLRPCWVVCVASFYECRFALARLASGRNPLPFADWRAKREDRGMSAWHDWVDWVGGLPFEVAKPESIINPMIRNGFDLTNLTTVGSGWGCNEYVFRRSKSERSEQRQEPARE
ncbi:MAG: methyltransferase [Planctomycetota bacterium]